MLILYILAIGLVLLLWNQQRRRGNMRLPPGPNSGVPLLGNLLQLNSLRHPGEVARLAATYGPIFSLRLGFIPIIFVAGRAEAHEALVEQGSIFASRTPLATSNILSGGGRSINSSVYGPFWRTARRNMTSVVATKLHRFKPARRRAVDRLVSDLGSTPVNSPVIVREQLRFAVFSIVAFMCFGTWLQDAQVVHLEKLMREVMKLVSNGPSLFTRLLQRLGFPTKREALLRDYAARRTGFLGPMIAAARRQEQAGELDPGCYIHALLQEERLGGIQEKDILSLVGEFLNAGGDTTAVTLEWALACLALYPDVQLKLFEEINQAANGQDIDESRALELNYLGAFIKEVLRLHPPGFSTLPHAVTEATQLAGYDIPANSVLFFHTYVMGIDPGAWEEPTRFMPERFLASSSLPVMSYAPFGAGRRICPGMALADLHLHYILARLLQTFEWSSRDGDKMDMSPKFEFTTIMNTPLAAVIRKRESDVC